MSVAKIVGLGKCIPQNNVDNRHLYQKIKNFDLDKAKFSFIKKGVDISDADDAEIFNLWVHQISGIKSRFYAGVGEFEEGLEAEDMAKKASLVAIEEACLSAQDIDHIIFSTYSSNRLLPSPACKLADMLGVNCSVRTLNGACSGFIDALIDASIKVNLGVFKNILVVAAEHMSNKINYDDPKSSVLFSDGAGACVVSEKNDAKRAMVLLGFDGGVEYSEQVYMERTSHILFNDGPYVQRNAVRTMHLVTQKALEKSKKSFADLYCVVPHQANGRIIDALDLKLKSSILAQNSAFGNEKGKNKDFFTVNCIAHYGNLSSASVPTALNDYVNGDLKSTPYKAGELVVLSSVGGGYTYAAMALIG